MLLLALMRDGSKSQTTNQFTVPMSAAQPLQEKKPSIISALEAGLCPQYNKNTRWHKLDQRERDLYYQFSCFLSI